LEIFGIFGIFKGFFGIFGGFQRFFGISEGFFVGFWWFSRIFFEVFKEILGILVVFMDFWDFLGY